MFNGITNHSFAAIKNIKQSNPLPRQPLQNKNIYPPKSFKEINAKLTHPSNNNDKNLDNQENKYTNQQYSEYTTSRKSHVNNQYNFKRVNLVRTYKSPSSRCFEKRIDQDGKVDTVTKKERTKPIKEEKREGAAKEQNSNCKVLPPSKKLTFSELTSACKVNRSVILQQPANEPQQVTFSFKEDNLSIYERSEKASLSIPSQSSYEEESSFSSHHDLSIDEEEKGFNLGGAFVNSSFELKRGTSNDFANNASEIMTDRSDIHKVMKKNSNVYCSKTQLLNQTENLLQKIDQKERSVKSVFSNVSSLNFSQKFKHYKKHPQKVKQKKPPTPTPTLTLANFKLLNEIGSGKYGKVYLAKHVETNFICALKSISKKIIRDENLMVPFIRQIKIQMFLNHPNIVKLYGFFHDEENFYMMLEYCSDGHLLKLMKQRTQFEEIQMLTILSHVYEAVSYIHCNGVIHRDLKPQNVVIEHGVFKLCDFGWAAYACGDNRTTFCGTPLYVSPELLKGEEYNTKTDIWGLGIITYELAFGRVPFSIISQNDFMKIIKDPVYFPSWNDTSQKLVTLIKEMLNKNADNRPSINQILMCDLFKNGKESPLNCYKNQFRLLL